MAKKEERVQEFLIDWQQDIDFYMPYQIMQIVHKLLNYTTNVFCQSLIYTHNYVYHLHGNLHDNVAILSYKFLHIEVLTNHFSVRWELL